MTLNPAYFFLKVPSICSYLKIIFQSSARVTIECAFGEIDLRYFLEVTIV